MYISQRQWVILHIANSRSHLNVLSSYHKLMESLQCSIFISQIRGVISMFYLHITNSRSHLNVFISQTQGLISMFYLHITNSWSHRNILSSYHKFKESSQCHQLNLLFTDQLNLLFTDDQVKESCKDHPLKESSKYHQPKEL